MLKKLKATITAYRTAAQAGLIVSRCKTGCSLDNENEVYLSCKFHEAELFRLAALNKSADEQRQGK